jgi:hypothetical protein
LVVSALVVSALVVSALVVTLLVLAGLRVAIPAILPVILPSVAGPVASLAALTLSGLTSLLRTRLLIGAVGFRLPVPTAAWRFLADLSAVAVLDRRLPLTRRGGGGSGWFN